jgi:hypothetical protein
MADKRIYIELLKRWGEYKPGDVAAFDPGKGGRLIKAGIARKATGKQVKDAQKQKPKSKENLKKDRQDQGTGQAGDGTKIPTAKCPRCQDMAPVNVDAMVAQCKKCGLHFDVIKTDTGEFIAMQKEPLQEPITNPEEKKKSHQAGMVPKK